MIKAHGGRLVNRILNHKKRINFLASEEQYFKLKLSDEQVKDVKNIARGVYSPLTGFLKQADYQSVLKRMRLSDGTVWSIPIILDINTKLKQRIIGDDIKNNNNNRSKKGKYSKRNIDKKNSNQVNNEIISDTEKTEVQLSFKGKGKNNNHKRVIKSVDSKVNKLNINSQIISSSNENKKNTENVNDDRLNKLSGKKIILVNKHQQLVAVLKNIEIYSYNKSKHCGQVYGTTDKSHPGVEMINQMGDYLIGGDIWLIDNDHDKFADFNYTPKQTRQIFKSRGWKTIVAFQTRNVPHRGHEFLQKAALNQVDGIFIQPVIGEKKLQDFKDEYIISCYQALIDYYYPRNKAFLGILPLKMRYAGPREAIFHALIRKNYGCTHFIVGRDHAGVKDFYGPYDAQNIFKKFQNNNKDEIGITILKYPEVVYDKNNQVHTFNYDLAETKIVHFSGTKLRNSIKAKKQPPSYLIRPEIYNILVNSKNSLVDRMYKMNKTKQQKGLVLWFTGLSQSGKSTLADATYDGLKEKGYVVERLDGDVVRESLTKDLGFTKEDRNENIRRVGFLAKMLAKNGIIVVASFISPYKSARDKLKKQIPNFVEIFVNTPLEICEKRDKKGLYAKARKGIIKNFTGISDPYEEPQDPDIELHPAEDEVEVSLDKVMREVSRRFE